MKCIISWTFCLMQLKKVPFSCNITQYSGAGKFNGYYVLLFTDDGWWGGWGVVPPHCSCHFNTQLLMTNGGLGVLLLIAHLTNQVDCSSAVKRDWLPSLYASTALASAGIIIKSGGAPERKTLKIFHSKGPSTYHNVTTRKNNEFTLHNKSRAKYIKYITIPPGYT